MHDDFITILNENECHDTMIHNESTGYRIYINICLSITSCLPVARLHGSILGIFLLNKLMTAKHAKVAP